MPTHTGGKTVPFNKDSNRNYKARIILNRRRQLRNSNPITINKTPVQNVKRTLKYRKRSDNLIERRQLSRFQRERDREQRQRTRHSTTSSKKKPIIARSTRSSLTNSTRQPIISHSRKQEKKKHKPDLLTSLKFNDRRSISLLDQAEMKARINALKLRTQVDENYDYEQQKEKSHIIAPKKSTHKRWKTDPRESRNPYPEGFNIHGRYLALPTIRGQPVPPSMKDPSSRNVRTPPPRYRTEQRKSYTNIRRRQALLHQQAKHRKFTYSPPKKEQKRQRRYTSIDSQYSQSNSSPYSLKRDGSDSVSENSASESYFDEDEDEYGEDFRIIANHGLKVRQELDLRSKELKVLPKGTIVTVVEKIDRRYRIVHPVKGWVSAKTVSGHIGLERHERAHQWSESLSRSRTPSRQRSMSNPCIPTFAYIRKNNEFDNNNNNLNNRKNKKNNVETILGKKRVSSGLKYYCMLESGELRWLRQEKIPMDKIMDFGFRVNRKFGLGLSEGKRTVKGFNRANRRHPSQPDLSERSEVKQQYRIPEHFRLVE